MLSFMSSHKRLHSAERRKPFVNHIYMCCEESCSIKIRLLKSFPSGEKESLSPSDIPMFYLERLGFTRQLSPSTMEQTLFPSSPSLPWLHIIKLVLLKYPSVHLKYPSAHLKYPNVHLKYPSVHLKYSSVYLKYPSVQPKTPQCPAKNTPVST